MYRNILLPVDLTEEGSWKGPLINVKEYARAFGSKVHLLTVLPDYSTSFISHYFPENFETKFEAEAESALRRFSETNLPAEIPVNHVIGHGPVYQSIIDTAKRVEADLIVMGAHRPELKDYLLGPNAAKVVRHSTISVLVVRD